MKRTPCLWIVLISAFALPCAGQSSSIAAPARAIITGIVIKDPGSEPVKKAVIELIAESQQESGNYTAVTGVDGAFRIEGVMPGRYRLFAERTGYLETGKRSEGRVLTVVAGQEIKDIQIHLAAAAVVAGRVTDEDGDPLQNAEVSVLRRTFASGHRRWQTLGSERTNDLGEYRVAGLGAGEYYVSVNPPPDFKSLIAGSTATPEGRNAASPAEKPATSYQTTYYPGTTDRGQATPIELHAGDEFPVNFSLTPSPTLSIRGSVVNLPAQSSAVIMLQSEDFNVVLNGAEVHKDGSFMIRDVSPGAYTIIATLDDAPVPMMARQALQVAGNNIEGVRLAPQAGGSVRGRLRLEGKGRLDPAQMFLSLRPVEGDDEPLTAFSVSDGFSYVARIAGDGSFEWNNVPPGNYYVRLGGEDHGNGEWFLKTVVAGGREADDASISVNGGVVALDIVASANGAVVEGIVTDANGEPVSSAVVVAVPEMRSRVERFRKTTTDQRGRFTLHGIAPGQYSLFAWENLEADAYYDAEFLRKYEERAIPVRVAEGDHRSVELPAIFNEEGQK